MSVMLLRQKVKDGSVEQAEAAVHEVFAALARMHPEGIRYASTRVVGTSTFIALLELDEGSPDPRVELPEFGRFLEQLEGLVEGPPVIEQLEVVGSYDLFGSCEVAAAGR